MAAGVYTRRIFAGTGLVSVAWEELYRPPAGQTTILRDVVYLNMSAGATVFRLAAQPLQKADDVDFWMDGYVESGKQVHIDFRQELKDDERLMGYSSGSPWSLVVTAYVFT